MFISADSIVPRPFDPQSLNRYAYCRNNPLRYIDPSGHDPHHADPHEVDKEVAEMSDNDASGSSWMENDPMFGPARQATAENAALLGTSEVGLGAFIDGLLDLGKDYVTGLGVGTGLKALGTAGIAIRASKFADDIAPIVGKFDDAAIASKSDVWAKLTEQLRDALKGKGNFGIGAGTRAEADAMGKAWVGEGYTVASDGKTLVSADKLRQYRPPSYKQRLDKVQANFEQRFPGQTTKQWQSNAHLDITD